MTSLYLIAVFALLLSWQKTRKFALRFLPLFCQSLAEDTQRQASALGMVASAEGAQVA